MSKKKNLPLLQNIEITGVAAEGKALTKLPTEDGGNIVVFVPYFVPGDIVDLQVTRKKHSFMEAQVVKLIKPAEQRCEAVCKHYGVCGGCKWQILPYQEQLRYKTQQVTDNLVRIGKIELPEIQPCLGSRQIYEYRNKLEFSFSDRRWMTPDELKTGVPFEPGVGFHIPGSFDKVLQIEECHLMHPTNNRIRLFIRDWAISHGMTFYNEHTHLGQVRTIMLRNNHKGEWMLVISFGEPGDYSELLEAIHQNFPEIVSLQYVINQKFNDTIGDLDVLVYFGADHIIEEMEDLRFKVGPKSFYQTNTEQAYELYKVARNFANAEIVDGKMVNGQWLDGKLVYDLYTGTGTIAQFVSKKAKQVVGIEYVPEAIEDAKENARFNNIDNCIFYAGDMKKVLDNAFVEKHGRPDVIITDPPRAGMDEEVIDVILNAAPRRIVYVSCNPATQARDLQLLDRQYKVICVQPVDMFPHTQHVENVVLLEIRQ